MKEMSEVDILHGVIDLLTPPEAWIKSIRALDTDSIYIDPTEDDAVQWCLGGAIMRVIDDIEGNWDWGYETPIGKRLHRMATELGYTEHSYPFVDFNNDPETTHEDLMGFLKEALADAEVQ